MRCGCNNIISLSAIKNACIEQANAIIHVKDTQGRVDVELCSRSIEIIIRTNGFNDDCSYSIKIYLNVQAGGHRHGSGLAGSETRRGE